MARKNEPISITIEPDLLTDLDKKVKLKGTNRSKEINDMLRKELYDADYGLRMEKRQLQYRIVEINAKLERIRIKKKARQG